MAWIRAMGDKAQKITLISKDSTVTANIDSNGVLTFSRVGAYGVSAGYPQDTLTTLLTFKCPAGTTINISDSGNTQYYSYHIYLDGVEVASVVRQPAPMTLTYIATATGVIEIKIKNDALSSGGTNATGSAIA